MAVTQAKVRIEKIPEPTRLEVPTRATSSVSDTSSKYRPAVNLTTKADCDDNDHSRMRKLLSHAFSDSALRQQEDILTKYFDLFVSEIQNRIAASRETQGEKSVTVDLTKWYNFQTFDIIGDMCFGESFGALEAGQYNAWMANLFAGVKYARLFAIASFYEPLWTLLQILMKTIPFFEKAKGEHENYCRDRTQIRVDTKTDRKDFMSYV